MAGHRNAGSSAELQLSQLNSPARERRHSDRRSADTGLRQSFRGRCRVLLIDDETLILRSLRRLLSKEHEVVTAPSGPAGLELLRQNCHFDAIFCDLMMPLMDGAAVFEEIEKHYPQLVERVVFCSGGAFSPRTQELLRRDCRPLVHKPLTKVRFEQALASLPRSLVSLVDQQEMAG